jgi:hypothetical protein
MNIRSLLLALVLCWTSSPLAAADALEQDFAQPPESTKPWVYWYWISDNLSKEGITRDLEAMKRVGIGEAFIGNIYLEDVRAGNVKALTEEWWGMVEHAIREGGRIGVNIGLFNCPGWSQSGGPWIQPTQAMRFLASAERRVKGPGRFEEKLPTPAEPFQDVAVFAFPAPNGDHDTVTAHSPKLTCSPNSEGVDRMFDGDRESACLFPPGAGEGQKQIILDVELAAPFTTRSVVLHPAKTAFAAQCELQVASDGGAFHTVRSFVVDRSNTSVGVGFMPHGPVAISFPPQTARRFRLVFTAVRNQAGFAEIESSSGARLERYIEKQLGKMHPTPLPMWDTYLWPPTAEPDAADLAVKPENVRDLSNHLESDGTLRWEVPPGDWILIRTGMTPTGTKNAPASPEGQGLEVDKMNRAAAQAHFDAYIGKLLARMPAKDRRAFKRVVADSYEMGSQNWTDGFGELFRQRFGYDPRPWLPVLTGRIVASADQSDRFLWDLRRLVADHVALDYVGGLRDACHQHGLLLWLENYGHWGFPAEFLQYGGQADQVSGEFWATGDLGSIELRAASSCAHLYGKPMVSAEAFTSVLKFESTPWSLKKRGDWALTEGVNHWVLHVDIHQPDERRPGVNAWFSTEFNRHNTWFDAGKAWIDYYRRTQYLLQQGRHVADVAYFIGEDAPKMTGVRRPALPAGYDFDYINAEVIERRLKTSEGRFVLPDGKSYRLLVLPELDTMRPEVLRTIRDLVVAGGTILGPAPSRSPSRQNFPACDIEVRRLATELWGAEAARGADASQIAPRESRRSDVPLRPRRLGRGQVFSSGDLAAVLQALETPPDVAGVDPKRIRWTHRTSDDLDIYFLSNQSERPATFAPVFRVRGKAPELWDAVSGRILKTATFETVEPGVRVPIELNARGSILVVFRAALDRTPSVVQVTRDGEVILSTRAASVIRSPEPAGNNLAAANTFTMAGWVKPDADIAIPKEANSGVFLNLARNDVVWAAHGDSLFPGGGHAGAGISAGRNGVVVYEHTGNYFAPTLSHAAPLTNWTHLAVVYEGGVPCLYLNGQLADRGIKSQRMVHSGVSAPQGGGSGFKGERGEFEDFARALTADEIAALAKSRPPVASESPLPSVRLTSGSNGSLEAEASVPGFYVMQRADGTTRSLQVENLPAPLEIKGPWDLEFPAGMDVPERVTLPGLASLTEHPNEAIQHFSGTVTYTKTFELDRPPAPNTRIHLDLGRVESLADVILNGQSLGVLWKPPFVVDATRAIKPATNRLELRVTGTWRNRLIGAAKYPQGFPSAPAGARFTPSLTADIKVRPDEPLMPFGLIGPVWLRTSHRTILP